MKNYGAEMSSDWKDIWIACDKHEPLTNEIKYEIWASHMGSGDQRVWLFQSRDLLFEKIRTLRIELGLVGYMRPVQPVQFVTADRSRKQLH